MASPKASLLFSWAWNRLVEDEDDEADDAAAPQQPEIGADRADGHHPAAASRCPKKRRSKHAQSKGIVNTFLHVDGLCCPSEVPVIERILTPIEGVREVSINPAGKSVTVRHDIRVVDPAALAAALNQAALGARLHKPGRGTRSKRIPARLVVAALLLALSPVCFSLQMLMLWRISALLSVMLTSPKVLVRSVAGIRRCHLDINTLVLLACLGALALQNYAEAATVLVLFSLADFCESRITLRARSVIDEVLALRPEEAELLSGEQVPVADLAVGTVVVVRQGDAIPTDGMVKRGALLVDESALSGESVPVPKEPGALVFAGTTNLSGYAEIETTTPAKDSQVDRLVKMIEEGQKLRSGTEKAVERFARYYTPCILIMAAVLMTAPWLFDREHAWDYFYMTLVLLVIACPCALVISTPVTYLSGIACAATHSMLVRGGVHLETLGAVDVLALDKTGTITEGDFRLREFRLSGREAMQPEAAPDQDTVWRWIAAIEALSSHPLALALVTEANQRGILPAADVSNYREVQGEGVHATVDGVNIAIGNERLANRMGWTTDLPVGRWAEDGGSVIWMGDDKGLLAAMSVADAARTEAADAVVELAKMRISTVMLTGDGPGAAKAVGKIVGISDIKASLRPENKIAEILNLRKVHRTVSMVGDGINDVPALAASHVGIAMGAAGKAAALEAADVVLMDSNLLRLVFALRLGRSVLGKIRQNIAFALLSKIVFVTLTLYGYTSLLGAIVVDVGSMLLVMLNGSSVMLMGRNKQRVGLSAGEASRKLQEAGIDGAAPPPPEAICFDACCRPQTDDLESGLRAPELTPAAKEPDSPPPELTPQTRGEASQEARLSDITLLSSASTTLPPEKEDSSPQTMPRAVAKGQFCASFGGPPGGRRARRKPRPTTIGKAERKGGEGDLEQGAGAPRPELPDVLGDLEGDLERRGGLPAPRVGSRRARSLQRSPRVPQSLCSAQVSCSRAASAMCG